MIEHNSLLKSLTSTHSFTEEEAKLFVSHFTEMKVKKSQFIIQPDSIAKYRIFVLKGAFKSYVIENNGQENILSLSIEDSWISDPNSYFYQQPSAMFVEALEESIVLHLDYKNEEILKSQSQNFKFFFSSVTERGLAFMTWRLKAKLTLTAEERYKQFIEKHPSFLHRVPESLIASYLGMTTNFLSHIRKKQLES